MLKEHIEFIAAFIHNNLVQDISKGLQVKRQPEDKIDQLVYMRQIWIKKWGRKHYFTNVIYCSHDLAEIGKAGMTLKNNYNFLLSTTICSPE